jgi:glycosyltransferase involved in cell wall biosynthesis
LEAHFKRQIQEFGLSAYFEFNPEGASLPSLDLILFAPNQSAHFLPILIGAALRVPVLSVELPGIEEFIRDGKEGFLFSVHDVKSPSELIRRLTGNPALKKALAHSLSEKVGNLQVAKPESFFSNEPLKTDAA